MIHHGCFPNLHCLKRVQTNPVELLGYGMRYKGILLIPCRSKEIYHLQNVQTIFGVLSVFCADGTMSPFSTIKRPGLEDERSLLLMLKLRICEAKSPLPHMPSWHVQGKLFLYSYL